MKFNYKIETLFPIQQRLKVYIPDQFEDRVHRLTVGRFYCLSMIHPSNRN